MPGIGDSFGSFISQLLLEDLASRSSRVMRLRNYGSEMCWGCNAGSTSCFFTVQYLPSFHSIPPIRPGLTVKYQI